MKNSILFGLSILFGAQSFAKEVYFATFHTDWRFTYDQIVYVVVDEGTQQFKGFNIRKMRDESIVDSVSAKQAFLGFDVLGGLGTMKALTGKFNAQSGGSLELTWTNYENRAQSAQIYLEKINDSWISYQIGPQDSFKAPDGALLNIGNAFALDYIDLDRSSFKMKWAELGQALTSQKIGHLSFSQRLPTEFASSINSAIEGKKAEVKETGYDTLIAPREKILANNRVEILRRHGFPTTEREAIAQYEKKRKHH